MIKVNLEYTGLNDLSQEVKDSEIIKVDAMIRNRTGAGADFLGWVDWPVNFDSTEYKAMKKVAKNLRSKIDTLIVIGIGGSYLGTRAADEMIRGLNHSDKVEVIYAGHTMSSSYTDQLTKYLKNKHFGIAVVSKSGTTTEPGIAFRILEGQLVQQVGAEAAKELIVAITDKSKGALKALADQKGYQTFEIPDDIGGRFSVLTPVGIFPLLVAGVNTDNIFDGAKKARKQLSKHDLANSAYQYAAARYVLNTKYGYKTEALVSYESQMQLLTEWWKQLFGESEGKDGKGLLPTSMVFSTDLHSLGQWVQEGTRNVMFETVIRVKKPLANVKVPKNKDNLDELNYLTSKTLHEINSTAIEGVLDAHFNVGKMPNIVLEFDKMDDEMFGYLVYWFEMAVAMSAYLLEVNPFNQPGVDIYKKNMFKLLGKPE
ncbi:glucose-6-phosphate isomerase [Williamsoniiplasma luminosum]|uniref:Glucose-6-phosphate isomerase n=1 Tax=Williamsoniiplasma luminosum TaxID=214888 RepID=A0A2K8NTE1_9MOLU|nr:glucose-6-phosphate isomerase [Williamsoniiplasma luminosum]ATZ17115.1 glucose-6-phosphate isomerase [Williamsoniiplasma luminosum]